jgi:hypothetical protein
MTASVRPGFVHRSNPDGTIDSICRQCFATVCTSIREDQLECAEKDHVCDPDALRQWREYANDSARPPKKPPAKRT